MSRSRLAVWLYGVLVAQIEARTQSDLRLRHTKEALAQWPINTPLISCSLPVSRAWAPATRFLRGLLPEGQHLQAAASAANVTTADTYGLLARYGRDVAGALIITRHDEAPDEHRWDAQPYDSASLTEAIDNLESDTPWIADDSELSIAGLQNKILLVADNGAWARPIGGRPSTHILKIDDPRYPGLVRAEHAALKLAFDIGLTDSAPALESVDDRDCLIVERFDRLADPQGVTRVHQEDICQALGLSHESNLGRGKYESGGGPGLSDVAELLRDFSEDFEADIRLLVRYMTFNSVIGNADAHGKNLALLHDAEGRTRLAPLYDTVPTALWPKLPTQPAMAISGVRELRDTTTADLASEAIRWRVAEPTAKKEIHETLDLLASASIDHDRLASQIEASLTTMTG